MNHPSQLSKQGGNSQNEAELAARVAAIQADNQRLKEKLEKLESTNLAQAFTQAVTNSGPLPNQINLVPNTRVSTWENQENLNLLLAQMDH